MPEAMLALGLPDGCEFTMLHCDRPMRWLGGNTSWVGRPGQGGQRDVVTYACRACDARATVNVWTPDA